MHQTLNTINFCILMITLLHNFKPFWRPLEWLCVLYTFIMHVFIGLGIAVLSIRKNYRPGLRQILYLLYGANKNQWHVAYARIIILQWALFQSLIYFIF